MMHPPASVSRWSGLSVARGLCVAALLLASAPRADPLDEIELTDGSVIRAEVLGIEGGRYRLRSPTLGTIELDVSQVRGPRPAAPGVPEAAPGGAPVKGVAGLDALHQRLLGDPDTMNLIMSLQNDPKVRAALADPSLMSAIASQDVDALRDNPRLRDLLEHPTLRRIFERIQ